MHLLLTCKPLDACAPQGSGRSDGEWVTLGAHEVDDLEVVIAHLRMKYPDSAVALWGRSMGAVTCLLYGHRDPSIAGMVGHALGVMMRCHVAVMSLPCGCMWWLHAMLA